jgi:hypothetical protein
MVNAASARDIKQRKTHQFAVTAMALNNRNCNGQPDRPITPEPGNKERLKPATP